MKTTLPKKGRQMQRLLAIPLLFVLMLSATALRAQDPVIHQNWNSLEESPKHIDASYSVVECTSGSPEIFIRIFNENPTEETVGFKLKVSQGSNEPVYFTVKDYKLDVAAMVNPACGSTDYSDLRFAVPDGFDPEKLTVEITYL